MSVRFPSKLRTTARDAAEGALYLLFRKPHRVIVFAESRKFGLKIPALRLKHRAGFTLVEMMAASVVLLLIMTLVLAITSQTSKIWKDSNSKIQAFQNARAAYNTLTSRLNQATLNTYLDYYDANTPPQLRTSSNSATFVPRYYARNSELHFVVDQGKTLIPGNADLHPSHSIFYLAPLGFTKNTSTYGKLPNYLNACGYFVEFNTDKPSFPSFLGSNTVVKERYRYRLMEFLQPTESLAIYNTPSTGTSADYDKWFTNFLPPNTPLSQAPLHILAENIIALVILPQRSPHDAAAATAPTLAPDFIYDSRAGDINTLNHHQLPPLLRVIMVAIDEPSAQILNPTGTNTPPFLGPIMSTLFLKEDKLTDDLKTLTDALVQRRVNYRVFDTTISIRGAKWNNTP